MRVGYVGSGATGSSVVQRLARSFQLIVWVPSSEAPVVGAMPELTIVSSIGEFARNSDVILLCLPTAEHLQEAVFGPSGLAHELTAGKLVIDLTSGSPEQSRDMATRLERQGVALVDATLADCPVDRLDSEPRVLMSGLPEACERAAPILRAIAADIFQCGVRPGDGRAMRSVSYLIDGASRLATLEVVAMGRKMGLSLATLADVLNKSTARNRTTVDMLPAINEGRSSTDRVLSATLAGVRQAVELGMEAGAPMPLGSIAFGLLQAAGNTLGEHARLDDIVKLVQSMAGTLLRDDAAALHSAIEYSPSLETDRLVVGYVGLGAMGAALVRRLLLSRTVHVFDARVELARELEAEGAILAPDLPSLARRCDIIMLCLPDSSVVRKVIFGEGGLCAGLGAGKIIVDQTTSDPVDTRRIAVRLQAMGVRLVDAPISGGPAGAAAGTIATICGGSPEAFAQVHPILAATSSEIVYCGDPGAGHVAKIVKNALGACNRLIAYEAIALGIKLGLKLEEMERVINSGPGWSATVQRVMAAIRLGEKSAILRLVLMAKDAQLAASLALSCGAPVLVAHAARSVIEAGVNELGADVNIDELARLYESRAAVRFERHSMSRRAGKQPP